MRTQEVWGMLAAGPYLSRSLSLFLSPSLSLYILVWRSHNQTTCFVSMY